MSNPIQIVADESMPGIDALFSDIANIIKVPGRHIDNQVLLEADALLCRSTTRVNQKLLANTKVKFVGTATIGIDHLDTAWLTSNQIAWSNAAGCNADAVAQYVLSAIAFWCRDNGKNLSSLKVGIVGAGNVGTSLSNYLDKLQIKYFLNDPPLEVKGDKRQFHSIQEVLACDVVTIHVPLTQTGGYSTYHLFDRDLLNNLNSDQLLINSARGAVVDNLALEHYLIQREPAQVVLDVFENEPDISKELVKRCLLASPHIAGHTLEGKMKGSYIVYKKLCSHFKIPISIQEDILYPKRNEVAYLADELISNLLSIYDIEEQSNQLKLENGEKLSSKFDRLRKNAIHLPNGLIRRDYSGWKLTCGANLPFG